MTSFQALLACNVALSVCVSGSPPLRLPFSCTPADWSTQLRLVYSMPLKYECWAVAVCPVRRWVIAASKKRSVLEVFRLLDGKLVKTLGRGEGTGDKQFMFLYGGACLTRRGTLLVADSLNDRLPEAPRTVFLRLLGPVACPLYVDCNSDVAVVSQRDHFIAVVWLEDGGLGRRLGGFGLGTEYCPRSKWGTTRAELSPGPAAPV